MKIININIEETMSIGDVTIGIRGPNNSLYLNINDTYFMEDIDSYIFGYFNKINNLNFNSILICGLGLGILPFYCKNYLNKNNIDVLDINKNLISVINKIGYLEGINLINTDVFDYIPTKKYDLIVIDVWWKIQNNYETEKEKIINNYKDKLNDNGKIYFPISQFIFS